RPAEALGPGLGVDEGAADARSVEAEGAGDEGREGVAAALGRPDDAEADAGAGPQRREELGRDLVDRPGGERRMQGDRAEDPLELGLDRALAAEPLADDRIEAERRLLAEGGLDRLDQAPAPDRRADREERRGRVAEEAAAER